MQGKSRRITGHVRVEDRKAGRAWVAKYMTAEGRPTRKVLGPAWVKDSGRRTARGAVRWRAADGPKPDSSYLTPADADDALAAILAAERARPQTTGAARRAGTFGEACDAYLVYAEREQNRPVAASTLANYRAIIEQHLIPEFGEGTPLGRLTTERIDRYRTRALAGNVKAPKGKPLSRDALRRNLRVLHSVLKLAARRGQIDQNPVADVESVGGTPREAAINVLTSEQVEAVARAIEQGAEPVDAGERRDDQGRVTTRLTEAEATRLTAEREAAAELFADVVRFAAYSGLRLGELRALRWQDVDFERERLHVVLNAPASMYGGRVKAPKSGKARTLPLTWQAARVAERRSRKSRFVGPEDAVFATTAGTYFDGSDLRTALYAGLVAAGLGDRRKGGDGRPKPFTPHDLRHTFGTLLAAGGVPQVTIQAAMGHASSQTTEIYMHYAPRSDDAARFSRALGAGSPAEAAVDVVG